jgi:scyllo-inositol 2-dehydrogenase (NADP+)
LIANTDGFALTAVVTGNPERAAAARERYPGIRVVPTVDELLAKPDALDLVVVASPNRTHVPIGLAAIEAGLPVVIDKPVAATVADAERLRDAAARVGVLVSVFHNRRWDADFRTLQKIVSDGALGTVHRFESRYERWRPEIKKGVWRENPDPADAGGLLYDLGSHVIDQSLTLFGPVAGIYAEIDRIRAGARVPDDVYLALAHGNGVRSHLWASALVAIPGPRFRALGSTGAYEKYGMDPQEDVLRAGGTPRDPGWGVEPEPAWGRLAVGDPTAPAADPTVTTVPSLPGAYQDFYAGLRDALRGQAPPPVTIEQAIDVIAVIEAAQRSVRDGVVVRPHRSGV